MGAPTCRLQQAHQAHQFGRQMTVVKDDHLPSRPQHRDGRVRNGRLAFEFR